MEALIAIVFLAVITGVMMLPSSEIGNAVFLVWLVCAAGIGFVVQRRWVLLLVFVPGPFSSLYQRTLSGGSGDGSIDAWRYVAGHLIFAFIGMVGVVAGWSIWRLLERQVDRSPRSG